MAPFFSSKFSVCSCCTALCFHHRLAIVRWPIFSSSGIDCGSGTPLHSGSQNITAHILSADMIQNTTYGQGAHSSACKKQHIIMTSSNGNIFRVTGPLWGESTDDRWIVATVLSFLLELTHWGRHKMDAISQTTFSSAFSLMKIFELRLKFHWSLFLRVQLTIFQHWFR